MPKTKARPKIGKKTPEEEKKVYGNPKYKTINIYMEKLDNMKIILTAENDMCKNYVFMNQI